MHEKELKKLLTRLDALVEMLQLQAQATMNLNATLQFLLEEQNHNGEETENDFDEPKPLSP